MERICHMTSAHRNNDVRIFEKECVSLSNYGYEVHLVAPGESDCKKGVFIHGVGEKPKKRWKRMLIFTKKVFREAIKLDASVYHFHDPELIPAGLRLKKLGKKVIFDSHENIFDQFTEKEYIPLAIRKIVNRFFQNYIKKSCMKFDAIISVDPFICEKYKILNRNTVMISNFPQIELQEAQTLPFVSTQYICFAGGISKQWNHDTIITAINKIEGVSYILCGEAEKKYLDYLKTLPGWEKVDYKGKIPHREALSLLRGSIAGVALCSYSKNTNEKEGTLGNTKLFEIMMCGIPVICTDFYSWRNIIENEKCGYCIPYDDSDKLEELIRYILKNKDEAIKMGINGREAVKTKYNWNVQERELRELYETLMSE